MADDHGIRIRPGTPADVEDAAMIVSVADSARGTTPLAGEQDQATTRRRLADPATFFVVADSPHAGLIGVAAGMDGRENGGRGPLIPGLCHVSMVAVLPAHWGQGIGKRLLSALIAEAHRRGFEQIQLFTHLTNTRAQALYEGLGFARTGETALSESGEQIVRYLLSGTCQ
ncbi:GNAT family N-acetyltransferase [Thermomonospora cellulosilytica]|uniref:Ribosomal protein S18 acetylase RimI-like enzyme n=1 Tax=Thermomonospora cellulosilytica TaxID=1411118 RepID=A0A7W3N0E3_9ACTN|nr:N-acetyltransferase [Thermomonospora cellulosilytica]MBA9005225.1 ribosomal protein S18 acetylase RimI-like enzyme [Thermomonospora cellulosilytica]